MKKICIVIISALFVFLAASATQKKIKLYALYTPSHETLKDKYFLPSIQDDFEVILQFCKQTSPSAVFMSQGWTDTTLAKVELIIRAIEENMGDIFIFSDVDIQFFAPIQEIILDLMQNKDIIMQRNNPRGDLCTGFFACRASKKTLRIWQDV
jgi:hypothetical protein